MKVTDERLSDKELGKWIEIMQGFMTGNNFDKFTCNGQILSALEELQSLRKIDIAHTLKYAEEAGAAIEELKYGVEAAIKELGMQTNSIPRWRVIDIIKRHVSKHLDLEE